MLSESPDLQVHNAHISIHAHHFDLIPIGQHVASKASRRLGRELPRAGARQLFCRGLLDALDIGTSAQGWGVLTAPGELLQLAKCS